ncbi:GntR family transcriptional regulator [Frigidibacter sp. MR17.14]|uniref:GntR family transcriptional regulator n=1 Tax=Frigidibacter sp. MR17.14 TaxID=3126509 RepID=UPI003013020C
MGVAEAVTSGGSLGRSAQVAHALRRDIVLGTRAPGEALRELELAQQFNVAQGTIREALMGLAEEGLVRRRARRDTHVAPSNTDDVGELLRIRHDIECHAARRVIERCDDTLLADLGLQLQAMQFAALQEDEYSLLEHDCRFHLRLFAAAALPVVEPILSRCLVHTQRYKILNSAPQSRDLTATANRHLSILDAVRDADEGALATALSHHITTIVDFGPPLGPAAGRGTQA